MELTTELKQRVIKLVHAYTDKANQIYGINMPYPTILFSKRGTTAGTASYLSHTVNFNAGLYVRNVETFLARTVPHEVAHLVTYRKYIVGSSYAYRTVKPHGYEWQLVMAKLGVEDATRCHSYDTSETKQKKNVTTYQYKCNCKTYEFTARRHNKVKASHAWYSCRLCRAKLVYTGNLSIPVVKTPAFMIPTAPRAPSHVNQPAAPKLPRIGSKKERAERLYLEYNVQGRDLVIAMFMQELDMTKAGASTYYANCKKEFN